MFGEEDNDGSEADGSTDNYISSLSFDPDVRPSLSKRIVVICLVYSSRASYSLSATIADRLLFWPNKKTKPIFSFLNSKGLHLLSNFADFHFSHDSEFDCLTSTEIEEKINMLRWYPFKSASIS